MASERAILDKGSCNFHQEGAFLSVKQYMLVEREGKRCLLLRLENKSERIIHGLEFILLQLDGEGRVIARDRLAYDELNIRASEEYALRTGIVLKKECINFRVQMVYAISGEYKFLFRNGQAVQTYDPRGYDPKPKKNSSRRSSVAVKQRYGKRSGLHGLIAFVGVLIIAAACTLSALKANDVFGTRREPEIPSVEEAPPTEYFPLG